MTQKLNYPGVNAHLNSFLQQRDGGWEMFHAEHLPEIRRAIDLMLPNNYYAATEKSLQISEKDAPNRRMRPDVSIYQREQNPIQQSTAVAIAPTAVVPLSETVLEEVDEFLTSVGIYRLASGKMPGELVTRIELLSPANKVGSGYSQYNAKRLQTLVSGVNLVELDYLHQTSPIVPWIASYPDREENATPYYVLVSNPQPSFEEGQVSLYAVKIDEPLPRFVVPLSDQESIVLDLQSAYTSTVDGARVFQLLADPTQPPVNLDAYSESDREWVLKRNETA